MYLIYIYFLGCIVWLLEYIYPYYDEFLFCLTTSLV